MKPYNLLVTCHSGLEGLGETEIRARLREAGAEVEDLKPSEVSGVFLARVAGDPKKAVSDVRAICLGAPELFQETHHWAPVERWVPTDPGLMAKAAGELGAGIGANDRWMLVLHKRRTKLHTNDLIKLLTDPIERGKVDLTHPEKMLVVEIIGDEAGMALVSAGQLLDVNRVREELDMGRVY